MVKLSVHPRDSSPWTPRINQPFKIFRVNKRSLNYNIGLPPSCFLPYSVHEKWAHKLFPQILRSERSDLIVFLIPNGFTLSCNRKVDDRVLGWSLSWKRVIPPSLARP
ncbi:hypothetical protein TNCV_1910881 [Trichonephila clavipes]|nr:hypothetical protein TNCV_1910881 [Trichonephila clavipes]